MEAVGCPKQGREMEKDPPLRITQKDVHGFDVALILIN